MLFRKISLHATEDNLNQPRRTNITTFAHFVHAIDFYSSPLPFVADLPTFKTMLHMRTVNIASRNISHICHDRLCEEHSKQHRLGRHACGDIDADASYESLWRCAQKDAVVVGDGDLQKAWTGALSAFENVDAISLRSLVGRHCDDDCKSAIVVPTNHNCCGWLVTIPSCSMGLCGDVLFKVVLQALASTGRLIKTFSLACEPSKPFGTGRAEPYWDELSLEGLERLKVLYMAEAQVRPVGFFTPYEPFSHAFLEKSHHTLQHLNLAGESRSFPFVWPVPEKLDFPKLRQVSLQGISFSAGDFANDIPRFQALERVIIKGCFPGFGDGDWRLVFDAIRGHPNILHVKFGSIDTRGGTRVASIPQWSLTFDLLDEVDVQQMTDPVEDLRRSLRPTCRRKETGMTFSRKSLFTGERKHVAPLAYQPYAGLVEEYAGAFRCKEDGLEASMEGGDYGTRLSS